MFFVLLVLFISALWIAAAVLVVGDRDRTLVDIAAALDADPTPVRRDDSASTA